MYDSIRASAAGSPLIKRQASREWELNYVLMDIVFSASSTADLQKRLREDFYPNEMFQRLPKFRQIALEAYFRGLLDAIARMQDTSAPDIQLEKPKARPPERKKRLLDKLEELQLARSSTAPTRPVPGWATVPPAAPPARQMTAADLERTRGARVVLDKMIEQADGSDQPVRTHSGTVVTKRRAAQEIQAEPKKEDPRQETETTTPPAHRMIGGQRRFFRSRRLR